MEPSVKDFKFPAPSFFFYGSARLGAWERFALRSLTITLLFLLFATGPCPAATILLDPGHGGDDRGAMGGKSYAEKQFTLALAQQIARLLGPDHRVELTRTTNAGVPIADRAGMANHLKADLMISLHAAARPYCHDRSASIYFHDDGRLVFPPGISTPNQASDSDTAPPNWAKLQARHQDQSQHLATVIKQSLLQGQAFDDIAIRGVPLVSLMGADLPAVLIEVGCMHASGAISASKVDQQIAGYAHALAGAVDRAAAELQP